jgi:hypothetical protein
MSKSFQFLKTNCFSEQAVQKLNIPRENVYEAIKGLLRGSDAHATDMIGSYFEPVEPTALFISLNEVKEIGFDTKKLQYIFDQKKSPVFMVFPPEWKIIEQIVEKRTKKIINQENQSVLDEKLKDVSEISMDYVLLKKLYDGNILFVNVF